VSLLPVSMSITLTVTLFLYADSIRVAKFPGQTTLTFPQWSSTPIYCKEVSSNKVEIKPSFDHPHDNIDFNTIDEMITKLCQIDSCCIESRIRKNQAVMVRISVS